MFAVNWVRLRWNSTTCHPSIALFMVRVIPPSIPQPIAQSTCDSHPSAMHNYYSIFSFLHYQNHWNIMSERRALLHRSTKGKNPFFNKEEEEKQGPTRSLRNQNRTKSRLRADQDCSNASSTPGMLEESGLNLKRANFAARNKAIFPYPRRHHYFYQLSTFPRVEGSPSYAVDAGNIFGCTYGRDGEWVKNCTVGEGVNRDYFQLPLRHEAGHRMRAHNSCHAYLFGNEDKNYQVDRSLLELKYVLRNLEKLEQTGKINQFSVLRKDGVFCRAIEGAPSTRQDRLQAALQQMIATLTEKKHNLSKHSQKQDQLYFHPSLDQTLHNTVQDLQERATWNSLILELNAKDQARTHPQPAHFPQLFLYNHLGTQARPAISQAKARELFGRFGPAIAARSQCGSYQINIPEVFFSFSEKEVMEISENLIAYRLLGSSEAAFYACKKVWEKLFGRKLRIQKEPKFFSKPEYEKVLFKSLGQLRKHCEGQKAKKEALGFPLLDEKAGQDLTMKDRTITYLMCIGGGQEIDLRQYSILSLFHKVYSAMAHLREFCKANPILIELIGSQFYAKYQLIAVAAVGNPQFGALEDFLRKFVDAVMKPDIACVQRLLWVFHANSVGYLVKTLGGGEDDSDHGFDSGLPKRINS